MAYISKPFELICSVCHIFKIQKASGMNSRSVTGSEINLATIDGDLRKIKAIKDEIGNDTKFLKFLTEEDRTGRRALHHAAELGYLKICKFFINAGVLIDVLTHKDKTPLMLAVKMEHVRVVRYLIGRGASVERSDWKGFTSLHYAVKNDNTEVMELLLKAGAPTETESWDGTPLQCAAARGSEKAMIYLMFYGAQKNSADTKFGSPVISSIEAQSFKCMKLLQQVKADPDKLVYGLNALALAAKLDDTRFLKFLIADFEANPKAPNSGYLEPIEHAALAYNVEGVELLFKKSNKIRDYTNWNIAGIMEYNSSKENEQRRERRRRAHLHLMVAKARTAESNEEYKDAIQHYSEAILDDPSEPEWLRRRSFCLERIGKHIPALRDAEQSKKMTSDDHE